MKDIKGTQNTAQSSYIWVKKCQNELKGTKIFQTEFMAGIYSESPVRANGKVLLMEFS